MVLAYNREEIEKNLLKSLLIQPNAHSVISQNLSSEDFSNSLYKNLFKAIGELVTINQNGKQIENSKPISAIDLFSKLNSMGVNFKYEDVLIFNEEPPLDSPLTLAEILRKMSVESDFLKSIKDIPDLLAKEPNTLSVIGSLKNNLEKYSSRLVINNEKTWEEELDDFFEECEVINEDEDPNLLPTPYKSLNQYINGGFKPGQLITIGARPGVGKTVVATNCAAQACSEGKKVLLFSLEMSKKEMMKRLAACHGNLQLKYFAAKEKSAEVRAKIQQVKEDMSKWDIDIRDDSDITMEFIRAVSQQKEMTGGVDLVIIDYLQLISTKGLYTKNRQEAVAEISRSCKNLARQLNVPVMILVQVNRETKGEDENKLPSMADIRESGAIAADSDIVLILHRKPRDDSSDPRALFILDKNRAGQAGKMFNMRCLLERNIFQDLVNDDNNEIPSVEQIENDGWAQTQDIASNDNFSLDEYDDDDLFGDM